MAHSRERACYEMPWHSYNYTSIRSGFIGLVMGFLSEKAISFPGYFLLTNWIIYIPTSELGTAFVVPLPALGLLVAPADFLLKEGKDIVLLKTNFPSGSWRWACGLSPPPQSVVLWCFVFVLGPLLVQWPPLVWRE